MPWRLPGSTSIQRFTSPTSSDLLLRGSVEVQRVQPPLPFQMHNKCSCVCRVARVPMKYQAKHRVERQEVTKIRTKSPVIKKYCVSHTKGGSLCTIISHTCSRGCCILFSRRGNRNLERLNNLTTRLLTPKTFGLSTISCSPLPSHPAKNV